MATGVVKTVVTGSSRLMNVTTPVAGSIFDSPSSDALTPNSTSPDAVKRTTPVLRNPAMVGTVPSPSPRASSVLSPGASTQLSKRAMPLASVMTVTGVPPSGPVTMKCTMAPSTGAPPPSLLPSVTSTVGPGVSGSPPTPAKPYTPTGSIIAGKVQLPALQH